MKLHVTIICHIALQFLFVTAGWSHGVRGYVAPAKGYLVTAEYDDGESMSYAAVEIKSQDSNIAFQTGRTDRKGHFMFYPDQQGQWTILVQDGMGHRLTINMEVTGDDTDPNTTSIESQMSSSPGMTQTEKIIVGLSIIFGIFGLWYGWKARRAIRRIQI